MNNHKKQYSNDEILQFLTEVYDPEIPVLNIVEMGIVRNVECKENEVRVDITPTYSGCPAMNMIQEEIFLILQKNNIENIKINTIYSPAWTTDWLSEETKKKLQEYGIAPPHQTNSNVTLIIPKNIECPFCQSAKTELRSEFGSTSCKSLYYCRECQQPFEYFKEI